jgi:cytochrome c oxidase subunit 3
MYCFWTLKNVYTENQEKHPFHLVDPSPWPIATALSALNITLGLVLWFHDFLYGLQFLHFGLMALSWFLYRWFRDIITESTYQGHHTRRVVQGLKYGMLLFLVSETMLFFSLFLAYFYYSLTPSIWIGAVWPPKGVVPVTPCIAGAVNTFFLLVSGVTFTWAHAALIEGKSRDATVATAATLILGSYFSFVQFLEYKYAGIHINDSVFGSIFFIITGLHGFHVYVGTCFVFACYLRLANPRYITFTRQHHFGFLAALWYWHFVDVVWLFVYFILYIWGSWGSWIKFQGPEGILNFVNLPW